MSMVKITRGGITTEVSKGELDWYKRNGWKVIDEMEPISEPEAVTIAEETAEPLAEKKSKKK